jgi:hypothetical protein
MLYRCIRHTDKKETQIFLIYKEIQSGAVAKSYMGKGFLIYEEMRQYFPIYEEPLVLYDFALIFFFIRAFLVSNILSSAMNPNTTPPPPAIPRTSL